EHQAAQAGNAEQQPESVGETVGELLAKGIARSRGVVPHATTLAIFVRCGNKKRDALSSVTFSFKARSDQWAREIVNLPKETPMFTPLPVPAKASDTLPLVRAWAMPDLTTPALASPWA